MTIVVNGEFCKRLNSIHKVQKIIKEEHAALGQHLMNSIKTGFFCSYTPDKPIPWETQPRFFPSVTPFVTWLRLL